jgi:hypothetical protein
VCIHLSAQALVPRYEHEGISRRRGEERQMFESWMWISTPFYHTDTYTQRQREMYVHAYPTSPLSADQLASYTISLPPFVPAFSFSLLSLPPRQPLPQPPRESSSILQNTGVESIADPPMHYAQPLDMNKGNVRKEKK